MKAPLPANEAERLEALRQYDILDTAPEPEFDDLTHLAAQICGTPISTITLVDENRQWFKSCVGLSVAETPRDISFCTHAIQTNDILLVPDASKDERFAHSPLVTSHPHIRFYAGVPLITPEGAAVGSLCVIDTVPRQLDEAQQDALRRLARQAVALLEARPDTTGAEKPSRQARRQLQREQNTLAAQAERQNVEHLRASEMRYRRLFESAKDGILILDEATGKIEDVNPYLCRLLGYAADDFIGKQLWEIGTFRDIAANKDSFRELQEKEYIRHDDLPLETKDGQSVSVEFVSNVYVSGDKKVIQCNIRDISRRKAETAALRESEAKFRQITENTNEVFWMADPQTRQILYVSPAYEKIWQRTCRELYEQPQSFTESIHPEDKAGVLAQLKDVSFAQDYEKEYRIVRPDGEVRWIRDRGFPVRNERGEVYRVVGIAQDITERKQVENALRASEERFQNIVANVPGMVYQFVLRADGFMEFPFVSEGCRELLEMEPAEIQRDVNSIIGLIDEDYRAGFTRSVAESAATLKPWRWEGSATLSSGKVQWMQGASRPQRLPDGGTLWDGVLMDVTARKKAEQALHKANDELELHVMERTAELGKANESLQFENKHHQMTLAALRHAADELQQANQELQSNEERLLQGNRLFTDLTHLRALETAELETALQKITEAGSNVLGTERCSVWLYNEDHSAIRCLDLYETATQKHSQGLELLEQDFPEYFKALESGQAIVADDARTHFATREFAEPYLKPLDIFSMIDTVIIVGGQVTGVLCCERTGSIRPWKVEDQTFARSAAAICALTLESYERARAEAEMQQARDEADAANMAKSEFLSRMSHELRTPLNAILGFGQILEKQALAPLAKESVGYILRGGRHLLGLINEVLDIARVEAEHLELSLESVDLADIVPEICALMQPLAAEHKVHLVETMWEPSRHCVLADRQRIKQVIINLLANAIKYNREGGQVEVACNLNADQRAFISVRDTGVGISPENLLKLFTPFERLDAEASGIEGTGLGLVLASHMTRAMSGTLSAQSTPGEGTTFTIQLPQADCPLEQLSKLPEGVHVVGANGESARLYSVLCIEDNASNLRLIEAIFEMRPDITLLAAVQGGIGLDLARQHEPDLILLDLNLPDIHGSEVLSRLQQSAITREIPVVVISADATPTQVERLLDAGAKAYLTKPLDVGQVLQTLDQFLQ